MQLLLIDVFWQHEEWCHFNHFEMTIMDAVHLLDSIVDESDPDVSWPMHFRIITLCHFRI